MEGYEKLREEYEAETGLGCAAPMWSDAQFTDEYVYWLENKIITKTK